MADVRSYGPWGFWFKIGRRYVIHKDYNDLYLHKLSLDENVHPCYVDLSRMSRLKTFRCEMLIWWIPTILSTISSSQLRRVIIYIELYSTYSMAFDYFSPSYTQFRKCDEILARLYSSSALSPPRPPSVALFYFRIDDDFVPMSHDSTDCNYVFTLFENLRRGGHYIGLRVQRWKATPHEVWWNDNPPPPGLNFTKSKLAFKAGW